MKEYSMSITKGAGNIKHNTRTQKNTPYNIDSEKTCENVTLRHISIQNVYEQEFHNAVEEYNQTQKRNDRKIKNYYSKILHDKKTKPFHELVISIGNIENQLSNELYNDIYNQFLIEFEKHNPQLRVFGAYIHHDEKGASHAHIDYVPVANYTRGLKKRVSNDKAIQQMNYKSWEHWREKQEDILEKVCQKYSISRISMHNEERHRTVEGYKKEQRLIEKRMTHLDQQMEKSKIKPKKSILGKETVSYEEYRTLEKEITLKNAQISILSDENQKLELKVEEIKNKPYRRKNNELERINRELENQHDEDLRFFESMQERHERELKLKARRLVDQEFRENKEKLKKLEKENNVLKQETKKQKQELKFLKTENTNLHTYCQNLEDENEYIYNFFDKLLSKIIRTLKRFHILNDFYNETNLNTKEEEYLVKREQITQKRGKEMSR